MKKSIDYKVEGGKLLRIEVEIENDIVKQIKITGDFFIHPEEGILLIEKAIKGSSINEIAKKINEIVKNKNLLIIGFEGKDVQNAILNLIKC
ncbi:MAG: lipoate protein ligase C-terminal domain-containing protein [Candidatus Aenigmatarchaeota archaeon]